MRILLLAPHPFFQERGTPIDVSLVLRVLSERGDQVDVVTYHEGQAFNLENITIYRTPSIPFVKNLTPGFSWKKIVCDLFLLCKASQMMLSNRYEIVHAVEEAAFIALLFKWIFRVPYVYDMDSSIAQQMIEKHPSLSPLSAFFNYLEGVAVRNSSAVLPVCDALGEVAEAHGAKNTVVLHDISLLEKKAETNAINLKEELELSGLIIMYSGNLESYQGIDLLLESFAIAMDSPQPRPEINLVIIGGSKDDIRKYEERSLLLGIDKFVHFLGPQPVSDMWGYFSQADILVSPRIKGKNTPMKIYSYLHSGNAVLATNLETHTQVMNDQIAILADPEPGAFAGAIINLATNTALREQKGKAAIQLIECRHVYSVLKSKLTGLYEKLQVTFLQGICVVVHDPLFELADLM